MHAHLIRADLLLSQGRVEMAIEEYRQALSADPTNARVHNRLATALLRAGRWNEALRSADVALQSEPNDPEVFWTRALIFLDREMLKEAESAIRRAIELEPDDAQNHGLLARILYERNLYREAITATDEGLALDAGDDLCLTYRARSLAALGRHDESAPISEELLREDPLDSWNHCLRGEELLLQGKPNEARVHFLESLRLSPGNEGARAGFATALKARSPLFGAMLALFLWTDRFKARYIWGALIVMFVGMRMGNQFVAQNPSLGVGWEIFKAIFFGAFILMFLANPMFDLILRFDKEGRYVLSDDEKRATNWYLLCFALAGLCGLWAATSGNGRLPRQMGIGCLMFCAPLYQIFRATPGYVRRRMAWLTATLAAALLSLPVVVPIALVILLRWGNKSGIWLMVNYLIWAPVVIVLFCAFSDTIRNWFERRRPD